MKELPLLITGLMGFEKAVVADGGVDLKEIDMTTMQSKKINNLFITGDLLHINRLIQYDEAQRADAPMLGAAGIICALAVAGVALKTIFYVWDKISGKQEFSLENFHLIIITVVLVSLPTVIGFHWRKIQSYQFQLRID